MGQSDRSPLALMINWGKALKKQNIRRKVDMSLCQILKNVILLIFDFLQATVCHIQKGNESLCENQYPLTRNRDSAGLSDAFYAGPSFNLRHVCFLYLTMIQRLRRESSWICDSDRMRKIKYIMSECLAYLIMWFNSDKPACKQQHSVWSGQELVDDLIRDQLWLKNNPLDS